MFEYVAVTVLKWTKKEFWTSTPRELHAEIKVHQDVNSPEKVQAAQEAARKPKKKFIDQVPFFSVPYTGKR